MMTKERNVGLVIVFSIITCGIYGFYWYYVTMRDMSDMVGRDELDIAIELLLLIFCWPYSIYWYYKYGKKAAIMDGIVGLPEQDDSIILLILAILGFGIISMALLQHHINLVWQKETLNQTRV